MNDELNDNEIKKMNWLSLGKNPIIWNNWTSQVNITRT